MKLMRIHWGTTALAVLLAAGCGRSPYDNPIANNSQQPDKVLFDTSIENIEKHRYELARITLQTLINTYPDSEYIAKAKLAIADSWYREGTSHALAQAEAEYKDFITFFPNMEEAAESQLKICDIHYEQMVKPDRDRLHAIRADQECRQLLLEHPNSRFVPQTQQRLREIQEIIAEAEYRVGTFYTRKGSYRAGANRLQALTDHYPLFSKADEALWLLGNTYEQMGEQFEADGAKAYAKLVRDYPLSPRVEAAQQKLIAMNQPIPDPDPERYQVMKHNLEHREEKGTFAKVFGIFGSGPDVRMAAKLGQPAMTTLMPTLPRGVRTLGAPVEPSAEITAETIEGTSALDTEPDARRNAPQQQNPGEENPPQPE